MSTPCHLSRLFHSYIDELERYLDDDQLSASLRIFCEKAFEPKPFGIVEELTVFHAVIQHPIIFNVFNEQGVKFTYNNQNSANNTQLDELADKLLECLRNTTKPNSPNRLSRP